MMLATALSALLALLLSVAVGRHAIALGRRLGVMDWPDPEGGRKNHAQVTPLVGGMAVVLSVLGALGLMAINDPRWTGLTVMHMRWFALAVFTMLATGMADDRFGLGPRVRLVFGLVVFTLVALYAPDFRVGFLSFGGADHVWMVGLGETMFTVACLVGLMNAVNMADGKNGLVIGLALIWTVLIWLAAPPALSPVCAALAVSLGVVFVFNMRGRLFLGDAGSYGISAIVGLLAIYVYNHSFPVWHAERVALLFVVPVLDTLRLITARALRGGSPFAADRDHLHHHIAFRWGWPRGLWVYLVLVAAPNLAALALPEAALALLVLTAVAYVAVLVLSTRRTAFNPRLRARRVALQGGGPRAKASPAAGV
jgi:UDP-GlcNAc:undecaprenyl-phosphate GlcNAc-1-phosphate transferase